MSSAVVGLCNGVVGFGAAVAIGAGANEYVAGYIAYAASTCAVRACVIGKFNMDAAFGAAAAIGAAQ